MSGENNHVPAASIGDILPTTRRGKFARLPKEIRDTVNLLIRDGATGARILAYLRAHKFDHEWLQKNGFGEDWNEQNVTNWRQTGYQDWLREQERLDDMRLKREFAMDIVRENEGSKIHEASLQLAASQVYEVLADFDASGLKEVLAEQPKLYPKLLHALSKLSEGGLKFERYREQVAERKRALETELDQARDKGGITPETLERIKQELNLL